MKEKKKIRAEFRKAVFSRDRYCCRKCGFASSPEKAEEELDAHHIINRNDIVNRGYVKENGISLCKKFCHLKAENQEPGFEPEVLFRLIGSSEQKARAAAK